MDMSSGGLCDIQAKLSLAELGIHSALQLQGEDRLKVEIRGSWAAGVLKPWAWRTLGRERVVSKERCSCKEPQCKGCKGRAVAREQPRAVRGR